MLNLNQNSAESISPVKPKIPIISPNTSLGWHQETPSPPPGEIKLNLHPQFQTLQNKPWHKREDTMDQMKLPQLSVTLHKE